ncbi:MAG: hypothetical protein AUJ75_01885 [Candidatus Omnitrophica bacterium CG1_02_49_10]|nr:MAG: hypothetical protein AUJ75_01885 [Candidatus Omnitrophica bacterium CG1_02_49_10]
MAHKTPKIFEALLFLLIIASIPVISISAEEATDKNFVVSINVDSRDDGAMVKIHSVQPLSYAVYNVKGSSDVMIDPLGSVYCKEEDERYFGTSLIKSVRAIGASGEAVIYNGENYYPLDFFSVGLIKDAGYDTYQYGNELSVGFGIMKEDIAALKADKAAENIIAGIEAVEDVEGNAGEEAPAEEIKAEDAEKEIVREKNVLKAVTDADKGPIMAKERRINAASLYKQGLAHYKDRRYASASRFFLNALEIDPGYKAARDYLRKAEKKLAKIRKKDERLNTLLDTVKDREQEVKALQAEPTEQAAAVRPVAIKEAAPPVAKTMEMEPEKEAEEPVIDIPERKLTKKEKKERGKILDEEVRSLYYKGRELYGVGDFKGARDAFRKILKIDSGEKEARELLGKCEGRIEAEKERKRSDD